jgi:hypothetical protein
MQLTFEILKPLAFILVCIVAVTAAGWDGSFPNWRVKRP